MILSPIALQVLYPSLAVLIYPLKIPCSFYFSVERGRRYLTEKNFNKPARIISLLEASQRFGLIISILLLQLPNMPLWLVYHALRLRQCQIVHSLFEVYGNVVRISPGKVVFLDGASMRVVYGAGRFGKSVYYKSLLTNENDHAYV